MVRMMRWKTWTCGIVLASAVTGWALAPVSDEMKAVYSEAGTVMAAALPRVHLAHLGFNDTVATNGLNIFLNALDPDHSFFLQPDIDRFRARAHELDDGIQEGDLDVAFEIYNLFIERVSNRVAYVDTLLEKGFDLAVRETYRWRRRDEPWPVNNKEWNELWRRKIKNQYVAKVVARQIGQEKKAEATNGMASAEEAVAEPPASESADSDASTNKVEESAVPRPDLTPEESIRKEYKQYLSILSDNDAHWLLSLYLTSFAKAYDPHSDFMSANSTEDFDINMRLSLVGIGALLSVEDGAAKIVRIIPGGPAERDGRLQAGDKIIAVGQGDDPPVDILHWPLSRSVRLIRGEKGTRVALHIIPAADISGSTVRKIELVRDEVRLEEQAAKSSVHPVPRPDGTTRTFGVIRVPDFYADSKGRSRGDAEARSLTRDVQRILRELRTNRIEGLVLDLRNNGGGLMSEAVDLAGLFIRQGPIVQMRSANGIQVLSDWDPRILYDGPMLVLVNRQSASASEIVAGALQDHGRALVVGDAKTHGKGTVQTMISVDPRRSELGTLKLTTASFYRINGSSTQVEGIKPDISIPSVHDFMEVGEEYLPHAFPWSMIRPARYEPSTEILLYVPELRQRSEDRRIADERFIAYRTLLDELGARRQAYEIALDLETRLKMAREEAALSEYLRTAEGEEDVPSSDDLKPDLILDEALRILDDLISVQEAERVSERDLLANDQKD